MPSRPFSTHTNNPETIDALHDGVPAWMRGSLDDWLMIHLRTSDGRTKEQTVRALERLLRADLSRDNYGFEMLQTLFSLASSDDDLKLDIVNGLLQLEGTAYSGTDELEGILYQSGSKWRVTVNEDTDQYSLEERVDETATYAMADLAEEDSTTSHYAVKAWNETFGRSPSPSQAYSNTIKAVEAASWPVVLPSNSRATLGDIIRELRDRPDIFTVSITERLENTGIKTIRQQMSFVWEGQTDRHGTAHPTAPTQEATEQALFTAISLCQQFTRNLVSHI